jgi:AcrR family transcriptional regulator
MLDAWKLQADLSGNMCAARSPNDPPAKCEELILRAAADLVRTGGIDALSTSGVASAAGVEPPVIDRHFGDEKGLLDAVTQFVFDDYIDKKRRLLSAGGDPLRELEQLWDLHIDFGLAHPHCYLLAYVCAGQEGFSVCAAQSFELLGQVVAELQDQGRLRLNVEHATALIRSASLGVVLALIALPMDKRDLEASHALREITLSAIVYNEVERQAASLDIRTRAAALREELCGAGETRLTAAEHAVFSEWLSRLARDA